MQQKQEKKRDFGSDFAPAMGVEPEFERPEAGRWQVEEKLKAKERNAAGKWADARATFSLETEGGPGFVDPGSFALAEHSSPPAASRSRPPPPPSTAPREISPPPPASAPHAAGAAEASQEAEEEEDAAVHRPAEAEHRAPARASNPDSPGSR
jgi:hypothetical protein